MSNFNSTVSIDRINELLNYNPDTGVLTWKVTRNNRVKSGSVAGTVSKFGHRAVRVDRMYILEHRAAWAITYGEWPKLDIDHINGDPSNNKISNLRHVSRCVNLQNQSKPHKDSRSGVLGVSMKDGKWHARIFANGKLTKLGAFDSKESAGAAYIDAKRKIAYAPNL